MRKKDDRFRSKDGYILNRFGEKINEDIIAKEKLNKLVEILNDDKGFLR